MSKRGRSTNSRRGAFGRGRDAGDEVWEWRWLLAVLLVLALLGKLGLI